jgi:hypothetical protein
MNLRKDGQEMRTVSIEPLCDLRDRRAVITGDGAGIGQVAKLLAEAGSQHVTVERRTYG